MHKYIEAPVLTEGEDNLIITNLHPGLGSIHAADGRVFYSMDGLAEDMVMLAMSNPSDPLAQAFVLIAGQIVENAAVLRLEVSL